MLSTLDATATNIGYVQGPFKRWISAAAASTTAFPVGTATVARPASISFTTAPTAAGTLTAKFVPTDSGNNGLPLMEGSITINKAAEPGFWRVSAADGLAGGTYSPAFIYTSLTGTITRSYTNLVLLKRVDSRSPWTLQGTHTTTTGIRAAPVLSRTGLSGFSEFTAGSDGAGPLLVQLVAFTVTANGQATVALAWTTASEVKSARFEVERSPDGVAFAKIGTVAAAAGGSTRAHSYAFVDETLARYATALVYYRLRQVDQDGTSAYSPVRSVGLSRAGLALSPNPARCHTHRRYLRPGSADTRCCGPRGGHSHDRRGGYGGAERTARWPLSGSDGQQHPAPGREIEKHTQLINAHLSGPNPCRVEAVIRLIRFNYQHFASAKYLILRSILTVKIIVAKVLCEDCLLQ